MTTRKDIGTNAGVWDSNRGRLIVERAISNPNTRGTRLKKWFKRWHKSRIIATDVQTLAKDDNSKGPECLVVHDLHVEKKPVADENPSASPENLLHTIGDYPRLNAKSTNLSSKHEPELSPDGSENCPPTITTQASQLGFDALQNLRKDYDPASQHTHQERGDQTITPANETLFWDQWTDIIRRHADVNRNRGYLNNMRRNLKQEQNAKCIAEDRLIQRTLRNIYTEGSVSDSKTRFYINGSVLNLIQWCQDARSKYESLETEYSRCMKILGAAEMDLVRLEEDFYLRWSLAPVQPELSTPLLNMVPIRRNNEDRYERERRIGGAFMAQEETVYNFEPHTEIFREKDYHNYWKARRSDSKPVYHPVAREYEYSIADQLRWECQLEENEERWIALTKNKHKGETRHQDAKAVLGDADFLWSWPVDKIILKARCWTAEAKVKELNKLGKLMKVLDDHNWRVDIDENTEGWFHWQNLDIRGDKSPPFEKSEHTKFSILIKKMGKSYAENDYEAMSTALEISIKPEQVEPTEPVSEQRIETWMLNILQSSYLFMNYHAWWSYSEDIAGSEEWQEAVLNTWFSDGCTEMVLDNMRNYLDLCMQDTHTTTVTTTTSTSSAQRMSVWGTDSLSCFDINSLAVKNDDELLQEAFSELNREEWIFISETSNS